MKKILLQIDTSRGGFTDWAGSPFDSISVVNGDTVLLCCKFQELITTTATALNLSGALALRSIVKSARTATATEWTFQDAYNGGHYPASEDLAQGFVTWLVSFNSVALNTSLGTGESVAGFLELTYLDANNLPQTLAQIPITVFQQEDDGAPGTPPPTSPTYLTAIEIAASYLADPMTAAGDMIINGPTGIPARLPRGNEGDLAIMIASAPCWRGLMSVPISVASVSAWDSTPLTLKNAIDSLARERLRISQNLADVANVATARDSLGLGTMAVKNIADIQDDIKFTDAAKGPVMKSADGTYFRLTVNNDGSLSTTSL